MSINNMQFFEKPVEDLIRERTSIRSYNGAVLDKETSYKVNNFLNSTKGPVDAPIRFEVINAFDSKEKLGTYGVIKGTGSFIACAINNSKDGLINLGFVLEKGILYATSLGLGTCWLGGTFKKSVFAKVMNLSQDEILPIVSPIGYPSSSRRLLDTTMRFFAGSKSRKPWADIFFEGSFGNGLTEETAGDYALPLEMLRLAPSASNKQPWRVVKDKDNNRFDFYLERAKGYGGALGYDIQMVDMGIGMCHFELTLRELGLEGRWEKVEVGSDVGREYVMSWVCR
jgi:hypothetical protein